MVLARYFDLIGLSFAVQMIVFKVCFLKAFGTDFSVFLTFHVAELEDKP
jgi:hypothetical protein